jgi:hypothetical protein
MAESRINTGDLRRLTTQIKNDTDKMNDLYQHTISKALEECQNDLVVSGVNFDDIQTSFKTLFTNLINQLNEFTDVMQNTVIPKYETTAGYITKLFNQDFANEMNEYIKIINSND